MKTCATKTAMFEVAPSQGDEQSVPVTGESQNFHVNKSPTPKVKDKISWDPIKYRWKIIPKTPEGSRARYIPVDPKLLADKYEEMKRGKYWIAAAMWDDLDKSNRLRLST